MIKFTNLGRAYAELQEELQNAYNEIHSSGQVSNGKYCNLVEEDLKRITGRKFSKMFPSGTSAILGALLAWDIKNKKVKDILFRILDETEEDYQNLCKVGLEVILLKNITN